MKLQVEATRGLADAIVWAANQADVAAGFAKAAGSKQDAADKAGHALELHLLAVAVLLALKRGNTGFAKI
jgi:hypothetical protein